MTPRTPTPQQHGIARVAVYEVQALATMLHEYIERNDPSGEVAPSMRSGLMRIGKLSDIIHEVLIADTQEQLDAQLVLDMGGTSVVALRRPSEAGEGE